MSYGNNIVNGFKCLLLDREAMKELAGDSSATAHGFLTLALVGAIMGLIPAMIAGALLGVGGIVVAIVSTALMMIVGFIIGYSIYHFIAKLFGGQATGSEFFRTTAQLMVINLVALVVSFAGEFLGNLVSLWLLVVVVVVISTVHKLSIGKSIVVMLLPTLVLLGLVLLFGAAAFL